MPWLHIREKEVKQHTLNLSYKKEINHQLHTQAVLPLWRQSLERKLNALNCHSGFDREEKTPAPAGIKPNHPDSTKSLYDLHCRSYVVCVFIGQNTHICEEIMKSFSARQN
jgi:hypothetical protein